MIAVGSQAFDSRSRWEGGGLVPESRSAVDEDVAARRVLIVDDDSRLRSLLRATLSSVQFEVREVDSAERARELIRFWRPRIVLLDVNLPGLDGLSFCAELAGDELRGDAAIVLLTADQMSETTARLAGARAVVRKPFSPLELLDLLARVLDHRELVAQKPHADEAQLLLYARDLASIAQAERSQRQDLQEAYRQTATALAEAADVRDRAT